MDEQEKQFVIIAFDKIKLKKFLVYFVAETNMKCTIITSIIQHVILLVSNVCVY